jgi:hypothetical protein
MYVPTKFHLNRISHSRDIHTLGLTIFDIFIFKIFRPMLIKNWGFNVFLKWEALGFIKLIPLQRILNSEESDDLDWASSVVAYVDWLIMGYINVSRLTIGIAVDCIGGTNNCKKKTDVGGLYIECMQW